MAETTDIPTPISSPTSDAEAGVQEAIELYEAAVAFYTVADAQYASMTETVSTGSVGVITAD